jgi:hypothetical protein
MGLGIAFMPAFPNLNMTLLAIKELSGGALDSALVDTTAMKSNVEILRNYKTLEEIQHTFLNSVFLLPLTACVFR